MFQVELTVVDLSTEIQEDPGGVKIQRLVRDCLAPCRSATPTKEDNAQISVRLQEQVLRFVQVPDKYLSLASCLLKSQAYHKTHALTPNSSTDAARPVVEVPRTKYRKPFIPPISNTKTNLTPSPVPEDQIYPFSISHQRPYAGMARLVIPADDDEDEPPRRPLVGLDIVMFDDVNPRLYKSIEEFMNVFVTSFTPWEFSCIHANEGRVLQEFYLRWAIKEAYTKALGIGMGLSFDSFETRLELNNEEGIYSWLCREMPSPVPIHVRGSIVSEIKGSGKTKTEECTFFFLPLLEHLELDQTMERARGCACVCIHNLPGQEVDEATFQCQTTRITLDALIGFHKPLNYH